MVEQSKRSGTDKQSHFGHTNITRGSRPKSINTSSLPDPESFELSDEDLSPLDLYFRETLEYTWRDPDAGELKKATASVDRGGSSESLSNQAAILIDTTNSRIPNEQNHAFSNGNLTSPNPVTNVSDNQRPETAISGSTASNYQEQSIVEDKAATELSGSSRQKTVRTGKGSHETSLLPSRKSSHFLPLLDNGSNYSTSTLPRLPDAQGALASLQPQIEGLDRRLEELDHRFAKVAIKSKTELEHTNEADCRSLERTQSDHAVQLANLQKQLTALTKSLRRMEKCAAADIRRLTEDVVALRRGQNQLVSGWDSLRADITSIKTRQVHLDRARLDSLAAQLSSAPTSRPRSASLAQYLANLVLGAPEDTPQQGNEMPSVSDPVTRPNSTASSNSRGPTTRYSTPEAEEYFYAEHVSHHPRGCKFPHCDICYTQR